MRDQLFSCHYGFSSFYTELCLMSECTGDSPSSSNSHPFYFTPSPSLPSSSPSFLSLPLLLLSLTRTPFADRSFSASV